MAGGGRINVFALATLAIHLAGCESGSTEFVPWPERSFPLAYVAAEGTEGFTIVEGPLRIESGEVTIGPEVVEAEQRETGLFLVGFSAESLSSLHPRALLSDPTRFSLESGSETCEGGSRAGPQSIRLSAPAPEVLPLSSSDPEAAARIQTAISEASLVVPLDPTICAQQRLSFEPYGAEAQLLPPGTVLDGHVISLSDEGDRYRYFDGLGILTTPDRIFVASAGNIFAVERGGMISDTTPRLSTEELIDTLGLTGGWDFSAIAYPPGSDRLLVALNQNPRDAPSTTHLLEVSFDAGGRMTLVRTATTIPDRVRALEFDSEQRLLGLGTNRSVIAGTIDSLQIDNWVPEGVERVFPTGRADAPFMITSGSGGVYLFHWPPSTSSARQHNLNGAGVLNTAVTASAFRMTPEGSELFVATHTEGLFLLRPTAREWIRPELDLDAESSECVLSEPNSCGFFPPDTPITLLLKNPFGISFAIRGCGSMTRFDLAQRCSGMDVLPDPSLWQTFDLGRGRTSWDGQSVVVLGPDLRVFEGRPAE